MSLTEIQAQIDALKAQAETIRKAQLAGAIAEIKQIMADNGLTPADIGLAAYKPSKKAKQSSPIRYRDPNTGAGWTGKGRPPAWVIAHKAAGGSLDSVSAN